ncbi:TonB-dependent receptor [Dasania sp. GY-MA-18]|uniref:TonB-dependent receptor n=1 Tax=Dasania phycosphaerae TaxID=2950436 RepID=A0A9J6RLF2_9GAMM|nr:MULTISPECIES: TonB-dependent receptor [Dasania]MCR8922586.1 TonB-dependent receptor [Dasania sp. GY-MA-18]MCZ0865015.1 TonB-dependent receptor [Dasania phycosphaerae]MCZ0868742.1 TonB-dependent receptor [Dasania phycosphaerae]
MQKHLMLPALVLCGFYEPVAAQAREMEHVLVTTPLHKSEAQTALPVTVISGEQLREQATSNLGETLGSMPGLANASFGPSVGQPVIRGQQGARVTVLQNGTGSGDASNSSADHAVSVEPVLAQSIEVLRGPATLLYGGGAIGGVINVIDGRIPEKPPEQFSGALELRHGSVNDENTAVLKLEGGGEQLAFHLSGVARSSNAMEIPGHAAAQPDEHELANKGFIANSDSELDSYTLGGSYSFEQGFVGLAVSRTSNEYGLPPGAHGHHEEHGEHDDHDEHEHDEHEEEAETEAIRLDIEQTRYDLRGAWLPHHSSAEHVLESLRWALSYSDYAHDEIEVDTETGSKAVGTHFSNEAWEGRIELVHREIAGWHGAVGLQLQQSDFSALGEEAFIPETEISRYGLFIVEDYHYGDVVYELGARVDSDRYKPQSVDEQRFTSWSLSSSALWQLDDNWQLGLALSSSERAPVTEELYSNTGASLGDYITHAASGVIELGNEQLDTEQANNAELSLSYQNDAIEGFITAYYNDFSDYIYLANTGAEQDETAIFAYRQQDASFTGLEFELSFALGAALGGDFDLSFFGDTIRGELNNSADVPRMPPRRLGSRLDFSTGPFGAYVALIDAAKQSRPGDFEEATPGYTRWDAGASYRFNEGGAQEYLVFVKLKNLSDEEIRSSVSFLRESAPEAGRSVELGLRVNF